MRMLESESGERRTMNASSAARELTPMSRKIDCRSLRWIVRALGRCRPSHRVGREGRIREEVGRGASCRVGPFRATVRCTGLGEENMSQRISALTEILSGIGMDLGKRLDLGKRQLDPDRSASKGIARTLNSQSPTTRGVIHPGVARGGRGGNGNPDPYAPKIHVILFGLLTSVDTCRISLNTRANFWPLRFLPHAHLSLELALLRLPPPVNTLICDPLVGFTQAVLAVSKLAPVRDQQYD